MRRSLLRSGGLTSRKQSCVYAGRWSSTFTFSIVIILGLYTLPALAFVLFAWSELRTRTQQ
jgi:hypothetical protein